MGIYIFKYRLGPWFKVGYHGFDNPWMRACMFGGFETVILPVPREMHGNMVVENLILLNWWPDATLALEQQLHKEMKAHRIGEW